MPNRGLETNALLQGEEGIVRESLKEYANALEEGNGDYEGVAKLVQEKGAIGTQLQADLDRLTELNVPVDIVFDQGLSVLGL